MFNRMLPTNMLSISFGRKLRTNVNATSSRQSLSAHANAPQAITPQPTILRREDGHHSAFANYTCVSFCNINNSLIFLAPPKF